MIRFALFVFVLWPISAQVEPDAGTWRTWVIPNGSAMRLPPPPDGDAAAAELQFVKDCAAIRDGAAVDAIRYWDAGAPAYRWMQLAQQYVVDSTLAGPQQTRALALVAAAISDATIAAWDSKYAYNRRPPSALDPAVAPVIPVPASPSYPSEHAVTAATAAAVLSSLFPDRAQALSGMARQEAMSRVIAGVAFPSDAFAGLDLGWAVGEAVVAYARRDGADLQLAVSYPPSPGVWSSPNPVTPLAGYWTPWVLAAASDMRLDPPPPFGSDAAAAQYAMDKSLVRTNATNRLAWFWQPGFFQPWLQAVDLEMFQNHLDANPPRAARAYAYQAIAQHDATLACWDTKYAYLEPRPSQADPGITTLFPNPQHPGYPSGHACASGASAAVLSFLFPADAEMFSRMAQDAGTSTFDAGIHTALDVSQGLALGSRVGQQVVARAQSDGAN